MSQRSYFPHLQEFIVITPHPRFNPDLLWFQTARDQFEHRYFPELTGLDEYENAACDAHRQARAATMIRVVTLISLAATGSQQEVADRLGIDRTAMSGARNHGVLGSRPLAMMFGNPLVWARLLERSPQLCRLMDREGFIAAAEHTAMNIVRRTASPHLLTHLDFELLCALIADRGDEDPRQALDERDAAAITARVLADPTLEVIPEWFRKPQRQEIKCWVKQLHDPGFAHRHLTQLQADWLDIFIYVFATLEGEGDGGLWQEA
jgi:hypothetical protein